MRIRDLPSLARALSACIVLAACSGGGSHGGSTGGPGTGTPMDADTSGHWTGIWSSFQGGGAIEMTLDAVGDGTGTMTGSACVTGDTIDGDVDDHHYTATFTSASTAVTFDLTISGPGDDQMNGTFVVTVGGMCTGDGGPLSFVRQ